ncbi:uncharacterized protein LOC115956937 [Quercus lobata]|uniref:uncharacterized protein LOC115956937 n=1 Tax=Quercus lobata TaxID=97700 RepID=UPI001248C4AA|nr:uncharacterized protein LOC115956937 [Quercus lobata]
MCKVFPFSLGSTALRWFNGLQKGSIRSFAELIQEFDARFVTCSRVLQPVDALLSIKMRVGETLRSYASRYWELYNEIGGGNENIAASTFMMGLPKDSELWELLTKRPPENMRQLMRRIEEYKRLEDDRLHNKRKAPLLGRSRQGTIPTRPKKDFKMQESEAQIEGCRVLKDHLGQLVKARYLKEFVLDSRNRDAGQGAQQKRNPLPPPLGVIEVIHAASRSAATVRRVLTVACTKEKSPEKMMKVGQLTISFNEEDLEGTIQPHDDALVVTAQINGFLVKRVMIDQGSRADVMYKYLGMKDEIQVFDVDCSNVRDEQFAVCKGTRYDINNQ